MPFVPYASFKGKSQGQFTAGSKAKTDKWSDVLALEFGTEAPVDSKPGKPTGRGTHRPVSIVREVDSASPLFFQALCTSEVFESVKLSFVGRPDTGKGKVIPDPGSPGHSSLPSWCRTIELRNALITGIQHAPRAGGKKREKLTFVFEDLLINGNPQLVMLHYS
ncbi:MAG: type VI secretion system tube protein Hcp [Terracidiphilus sp.]|jgi:type VI protein secretion system component Hcp